MENDTLLKDHPVVDKKLTFTVSDEKNIIIEAVKNMVKTQEQSREEKTKTTNYIEDHSSYKLNLDLDRQKKINRHFFKKSQNWLCFVVEINEDTFLAKMIDLDDESDVYEEATFSLLEVSPGDLSLLKNGAAFYYSVGYSFDNGQISKRSYLRFKRSAPIEDVEFDKIVDNSRKELNEVIWE